MKYFHETLFWAHLLFIIIVMFIGLVFPLWLVVILIVLHRIHVIYFGSCLFSVFQQKTGGLSTEENFLQDVTYKLFKKKITKRQTTILDYTIVTTSLVIAIVHTLLK